MGSAVVKRGKSSIRSGVVSTKGELGVVFNKEERSSKMESVVNRSNWGESVVKIAKGMSETVVACPSMTSSAPLLPFGDGVVSIIRFSRLKIDAAVVCGPK